MLGQSLRVVRQQQPPGAAGVNFSLEQVAKKVAEGGVHPKVRAWTLEQLERGRRELGLKMDCERDRASVLLRAVQRKLWVPDPVGSEFLTGAHLLACNRSTKDEICFLSGDCDDLTVLLGACFLSAGLQTAVVGHAYDGGKNISHVLSAVRVDGKWMYSDPTPTNFKLGECVEFTREKILSVPNVRVVCDADVCFKDGSEFHPHDHDFVTEGVYVGVDGLPPRPKFFWIKPISALGQQTAGDEVYDGAYRAANQEVDKQSATGKYDAKKIAAAAGAGAAAAGCAAAGAAVASPFCAAVGAKVGEWVASVFESGPVGSGFAGGIIQVQAVQVLRKELAGEDWSYAQAEAYLNKMKAPCSALQKRILDNGGRSGDDFKPVAVCIQKLEAKIFAEFSAIGAAKAARSTPPPKRSKLLPVAAAGAAGAAAWYFWSDIVRFFR